MLEMIQFQKVAELLTREQNVTDDLVAGFKQELEVRVVTQIPQEVGLQQGLRTGQQHPQVFACPGNQHQPTNQSTNQLISHCLSINKSANQPVGNQTTSEVIILSVNKSINPPVIKRPIS